MNVTDRILRILHDALDEKYPEAVVLCRAAAEEIENLVSCACQQARRGGYDDGFDEGYDEGAAAERSGPLRASLWETGALGGHVAAEAVATAICEDAAKAPGGPAAFIRLVIRELNNVLPSIYQYQLPEE